MHTTVKTSGGSVEVVVSPGDDPVLYFHGGHESAVTADAARLYSDRGVVAVSRPGYGLTQVTAESPADFAEQVDEVRDHLGLESFVAVVGTSFGGPQAVAYAGLYPGRARSLILHSAAPSTLPYPDTAMEGYGAPLIFHPRTERFTWRLVSELMRRAPDAGLRMMLGPLSERPPRAWLPALSAEDQQEMRDVFCSMRSGRGFLIDIAHAKPATAEARRRAQRQIACPTLITASRDDAGVAWAHAEDFRSTIPGANLVEIDAPSHLFWIGPPRAQVVSAVRRFLSAAASGR